MFASALHHPRCMRPVRRPAAPALRTGTSAPNRYSTARPGCRRYVGARADSKSDGTKAAGNAQPAQPRWDFMGWLDGILHPQGVPVASGREESRNLLSRLMHHWQAHCGRHSLRGWQS